MTSSTPAKRTGQRSVSAAFVALTLTTGLFAAHAYAAGPGTTDGRAWGSGKLGTVVTDGRAWGGAGTVVTDGRAWGGAGTSTPDGRAWG